MKICIYKDEDNFKSTIDTYCGKEVYDDFTTLIEEATCVECLHVVYMQGKEALARLLNLPGVRSATRIIIDDPDAKE